MEISSGCPQSRSNNTFTYNAQGQLSQKTVNGVTSSLFYNLDGRLAELQDSNSQTLATYEYDPFGRRISKTLASGNTSTYYYYADEGLIGEYDQSGNLIQSYGYQPDSVFTTAPVYSQRPDFSAQAKDGYVYYLNDHLGTPQKLITETGQKVWEASANAFGETLVSNDLFRNPLRFPGQYFDEESGLYYNYHRYYDPSLGRYITSDPIGLEGGLNTYGYAYQNPLNWIDPKGLDLDLLFIIDPAAYNEHVIAPQLGVDPYTWEGTNAINDYNQMEALYEMAGLCFGQVLGKIAGRFSKLCNKLVL